MGISSLYFAGWCLLMIGTNFTANDKPDQAMIYIGVAIVVFILDALILFV